MGWGRCTLKGGLSCLKQFLAIEIPLKMVKNALVLGPFQHDMCDIWEQKLRFTY